MNILYYCDEYPPYRNGGIGSVVKLTAEEFARLGHSVVVTGDYSASSVQADFKEYSFDNGVHVYRMSKSRHRGDWRLKLLKLANVLLKNGFSWLNYLIAKRKVRIKEQFIAELIDKHAIDIIELADYQDELLHGLNRPTKFRKYTVPTIIRVHGSCSFIEYYANGNMSDYVLKNDRNHFLRADKICAVSKFSADFAQKYLTNNKIDVIYNPIEERLFRQEPHEPSDNKSILFFGKIVKTKGAFSLIKAFNSIAKYYPYVELRLIGRGDVEQAKLLVAAPYRSRVTFVDFIPKKQIISEIDASLFCVLPSYFENFSMSALEVQARAKALIYTKRASGAELITDGENGLLADPDNIAELTSKIRLLLDNPSVLQSVSQKGYERCRERFSTEVIIPQLESYYQAIIKAHKTT